MTREPIYLGDGAYADMENGMVRLSTCDGIGETNVIYLEPAVLRSFLRWLGVPDAPR